MIKFETKQELFDFVATKLFEQGEPSVDSTGRCLYRGPRGLKCAAGHLLDDGDEVTEGLSFSDNRGYKYSGFVNQLQSCHDNAADNMRFDDKPFLTELHKGMSHLAGVKKLSTETLDKLYETWQASTHD